MIIKIWDETLPGYDPVFDKITNTMWGVWIMERRSKDIRDSRAWKKRFGCSLIRIKSTDDFCGLRFKNKSAYMLFLLEWS